MNNFPIFRNSNYVHKHIVDAEELNRAFSLIMDSAGSASFKDLIEATGQTYNPLVTDQLINGIVQLIVAANYFKDIGTVNNLVLDAYTPGYGIPTQYINNMQIKFSPAYENNGDVTLSFKGLSPVKLLTDMGAELSAGSLLPSQNYSAIYDASKSAFILSSSFEDSGSQAISDIRTLVESVGINFSSAVSNQLAEAVAIYSLTTTYDTVVKDNDIQQNNYTIKPFGNQISPSSYINGMVFRFRPPFENTLRNPTVQLEGLNKCSIYNSNGDSVQVGDLNTSSDVILKYIDGSMYLVSNRVNSIQLNDGVSATSISNDVSLGDGSIRSIPTQYAVKSYVDAKVKAQKYYSVVSGKMENDTPTFIQKYSDTSLNILAGESGKPSYHNLVNPTNIIAAPNKPDDTTDPDEIITYKPSNMVDGDNSTYYETSAQGSDVLGVKDPISGEWTLEPSYIGAKDLTENIAQISILGTSSQSSPQYVKLQYATVYSSGGDYDWQDIGDIEEYISPEGVKEKRVIPTEYLLSFSSGTPSTITLDNFVPRADATDTSSSPVYPYAFRVVPMEFSGENVGWEVSNFALQVQDNPIDPLVISYADGSIDYVVNQSTVSLDTDTALGEYWLIKYFEGDYEYVPKSSLYEGFDEPVNPQESDLWTKISSTGIETYSYNSISATEFGWEKTEYVKLASVTVGGTAQNPKITSFYPLAFGGRYTRKNVNFSNSPMTFTHNIGDNTVSKVYITCVSNDGSYAPGDTVELSNYSTLLDVSKLSVSTTTDNTTLTIGPHEISGESYPHTITPNPHNHISRSTVSGSVTSSYSTVVSSPTTATLLYSNISLPNKSTGVISPITTSRWKISITCERSF